MSNHIHILVHEECQLELFVKKLASSYVFYFNRSFALEDQFEIDGFQIIIGKGFGTDAHILRSNTEKAFMQPFCDFISKVIGVVKALQGTSRKIEKRSSR